jgi:hypothetical protein
MNNDEKIYLDKLIKEYQNQYLKKIQNDLQELFKQAIEEAVYDQYSPTVYERTYQLRDRFGVKFQGDKLIIYNDTDNMNYASAVDGRDVTGLVPYIINTGHSDDTGINNMYHNYPSRNFLSLAKEMINRKYPELKVEIISDTPPMV